MTMAELATIVQERLDINIAIINNGFLGMVRQWQEFFYERRYAATPLLSPDFVKIAEAYGIRGDVGAPPRRRHPGGGGSARVAHETVLIDFAVEQEDTVYPMVPAGRGARPDDPASEPDRRDRGGLTLLSTATLCKQPSSFTSKTSPAC